jgi:uncharacterized protein (TIGR03086 family)
MTTPVLDLLDRSLSYADAVIAGITGDRRAAATPCPGFTVDQLASHLVGGLAWFAGVPTGGPTDPTAVPEPDLSGQPLTEPFRWTAELARSTWTPERLADTLPLPMGDLQGEDIARYMVVEVLGHSWDLAVSSGQAVRPADDLAEGALTVARELPAEALRSPGMMGPPVDTLADAPAADRFAAFLGRDPAAWR